MKMGQQSRQSLREQMAERRRQLTLKERHQKARGLLSTLATRTEFLESQSIAAYWPIQGEIDPLPLLKLAFALGKCCYLPVLHASKKRQLLFYEYQPQDVLTPNRYGIPEPLTTGRDPIAGWRLNLVLVPLLAFSEQGQRLGRGAGHYDYSFSFLLKGKKKEGLKSDHSELKHPKFIGLAYEFQKATSFPNEAWDVPLDGIATEKRFIISEPTSEKLSKETPEHPCQ